MNYLSLPFDMALTISHPFLINKYTRWYFNIIETARQRKKFDGYTESHHIIPDCFYIKNRSKGKNPGWIDGNSNEKSNLVELTAKEHFICHWLLTKMIEGKPRRQMEKALAGLCRSNNKQIRIMTAGQYSRGKLANSLARKGTKGHPCSPELAAKLSRERKGKPGRKWTEESKAKKSNSSKGKKRSAESIAKVASANTGKKRSDESKLKMRIAKLGKPSPLKGKPSGKKGKIVSDETREKLRIANTGKSRGPRTTPVSAETCKKLSDAKKGTKYWNNGIENKVQFESPGEGWILGKLMPKDAPKVHWWNNGEISKTSTECPGPEWIPGRLLTKLVIWNNGFESTKSYICPGDGWVRGKLFKTNKRWWNNGIKNICVCFCPGPEWVPGRLNNKGSH
jgi:hypothetical protein